MIHVILWNWSNDSWYVTLPHEINNEFLWNAWRAAKEWKIKGISYIPSFWDFWTVEFSVEKLDKLYNDFEILEKNLGEIIKIVPLPKKIWWWEAYSPKFIVTWEDSKKEFKNSFSFMDDEEIEYLIHKSDIIEKPTDFTKEDMLLIILLIKKKILEAKEKWETLVFSAD